MSTLTLDAEVESHLDYLVRKGRYLQSIAYIDACQDTKGASVNMMLEKARIVLMANEPAYTITDAERCLLRALELEPENLITISLLSRLYSRVLPNRVKLEQYDSLFNRIVEKKRAASRLAS